MNRNRRVGGFTMAEMLIVVAIVMVLGGVAFVAVTSHQRSMAQLERDTIAKEIFFAAQNHLTMAESQGFLPDENGTVDFGNKEAAVISATGREYNNVFSFPVSGGSSFTGNSILDLMLPFGSIDETVRAGGSYIIRYQAKPALVLDVFYCPKATSSSGQLNYTHDLGSETYSSLAEYAGVGKNRKNCLSDNCVLGWYGEEGEEGIEDSGEYVIETPTIEVINKERLIVNITDPNKDKTVSPEDTAPLASLCLIITGEKDNGGNEASRAQIAILLNVDSDRVKWIPAVKGVEPHYEVILDDITTPKGANGDGMHFADLNTINDDAITVKKDASGNPIKFKPGENITVQAVAYSNSKLTNIAYSVEKTTNSLFADSQIVSGSTARTAMIGNIRHLENLDASISGLNTTLGFTKAEQIIDLAKSASGESEEDDLSWTGFVSAIKKAKNSDSVKVYAKDDETGTEEDCYRPIDLNYILEYDGKYHKIEGIEVKYAANAGLFGSNSTVGSKVSNLELIDFNITTTSGDAGALAGTLMDATVTNVVAYNTPDFETELAKTDATKTAVSTKASGAVGGLIGRATNCTIQKSAASLIVKSEGDNAGGLIGTTAGGNVIGCYAGGHAIDKKNGTGDSAEVIGVTYDTTNYNVTASGVAGGLIGEAGATTISYSYSTCSATGATVGGLIGTGSGAITYSYCTGKVSGTTQGAFAGDWKYSGQTEDDRNGFFEIVNEFTDPTIGYDYLTPVPKDKTSDGKGKPLGITAIDGTAQSYNDFCDAPTEWKPAIPYKEQTMLETYYGGKYNLKTVAQLTLLNPNYDPTKEIKVEDGSGNVPADFVATHYGDWPAPEIFVVNTQTN